MAGCRLCWAVPGSLDDSGQGAGRQMPLEFFRRGVIIVYMKEQVSLLKSFMFCCARQGMGLVRKIVNAAFIGGNRFDWSEMMAALSLTGIFRHHQ
jgi:hypothetical protein